MSDAKTRVMDKAEELFMERGYKAVKLQEIAKELKIKQPSLYYHFPKGKEDLYVQVVERAFERLQKQLTLILEGAGNSIEAKLRAISKWSVEHVNMSLTAMMQVDMPALSPENEQHLGKLAFQSLFGPLIGVFESAKAQKQIKPINSPMLAGVVVSMIEGINQANNWDNNNTKEEMWEEVINTLLHGIIERN